MVSIIILRDGLLTKTGRYPCRWLSTKSIRRQRRDDIWIPTVKIQSQNGVSDATQLLIRAGYIRQAYAGIFHLLPLGLRVQDKLERLIDKHMQSIQASKVSLSSVSSQKLWARSGRLDTGAELFKFQDRKGSKWLLAPTHEEEITNLVQDVVHNSSQLPIRLYQISRKYRDEKRPRGGLLRGREFIMKDLYTFDATSDQARLTYDRVRQAYRNLLDELTVPYLEARADSGNMGGNLSHEYHFPSISGEDDVINCDSCDHARNEEWIAECTPEVEDVEYTTSTEKPADLVSLDVTDGSKTSLVRAFAPQKQANGDIVALNPFAIKAAMKDILQLDTGVEEPRSAFLSQKSSQKAVVYYLFDPAIDRATAESQIYQDQDWLAKNDLTPRLVKISANSTFSLLKQSTGDSCPQCNTGKLQVTKAIEVGHTFHLGTRYSAKLGLIVRHNADSAELTPVEMGCHGIGVSRLVAATASALSDERGLNWPAVIAPFQVVIVVDGRDKDRLEAAEKLYDDISQSVDVLLDDRINISNGYKLKDADMIGYPVIVVVGRGFAKGQLEIQCRVQGIKKVVDTSVAATEVTGIVSSMLK